MRHAIITRQTPLIMSVICLFFVSGLQAQTTVLSQSFKNLNDKTVYTLISSYDGWTFENCYAAGNVEEDHYLRVGTGTSPSYTLGSVTSPALGVEGNVVLLISSIRFSIPAKYRVSLIGGGIIASTEYTMEDGEDYHPSAILVKGCLPSTRIVIEGTYGKFYLQSVKAFAVSDAVFYESFDYILGKGGRDGNFTTPSSLLTESNAFDAYSGVEYSDIRRGKKCIAFNLSGEYYKTPTFSDVTSSMLLSFQVAGTSKSDGTPMSVEISGGGTMNTTSFEVENSTWTQCYAVVSDMTTSTRFTFQGKKFFLDDVKLTPIPDGLDQSKDNTAYIEANAGEVRTVTLTRSLTPDVWCPLCLPFDVTPAMITTVSGTTCELCTFSSVDTSTGVFHFNGVDSETTIEAGTPFLIKTSATVTNPTFTGVTIKNVEPVAYTSDDYQFVGIYSPTYLETDGTNLFLGTDGNLYKPSTDEGYNRLGGMRAYFVVPAEAPARVAIFDEPSLTKVSEAVVERRSPVVSDLLGRRVSSTPSRGIVITKGRKWILK